MFLRVKYQVDFPDDKKVNDIIEDIIEVFIASVDFRYIYKEAFFSGQVDVAIISKDMIGALEFIQANPDVFNLIKKIADRKEG